MSKDFPHWKPGRQQTAPQRQKQLVPVLPVVRPEERRLVLRGRVDDLRVRYHVLDVRDQLDHVDQALDVRLPLDLLELVDGQGDEQVAEDQGDEDDEREVDDVRGARVGELLLKR